MIQTREIVFVFNNLTFISAKISTGYVQKEVVVLHTMECNNLRNEIGIIFIDTTK